MPYIFYFILFVFGLIAGSFLNVVIWRYRPGGAVFDVDRLGGRSRCPVCQKTLSWRELLPLVSFLVQRGKCRHCGRPISFRYFLVEFLSGLVFVAVPVYLADLYGAASLSFAGQSPVLYYLESLIWICALLVFLLVAFIDYRHRLIPDGLNLALVALGGFLAAARTYYGRFSYLADDSPFLGQYNLLFFRIENIFLDHLLAAAVGAAIFGSIILLTAGRGMGWGDFKLAAAAGWLFGWPDVLPAVFLSFVIGGFWAALLMIIKRKKLKDYLPFGPFLVLGFVLVFFFGASLFDYYFKILVI